MIPEIRVHPEEGWIATRDRPDSARPWAKVVPGISLTSEDVDAWISYVASGRPNHSLVERAALVMSRHALNLNDLDADRNAACVCGRWREGDPSVCPGWDDHIAEALNDAGLLRDV